MKRILFFVVLFALSSCFGEAKKASIIPRDKMIDVMTEVYILEMYYQKKYATPSVYKPALEKSLKKLLSSHGLTLEEYNAGFTYYSNDYEAFQEMNLEIIQRYNESSIKH